MWTKQMEIMPCHPSKADAQELIRAMSAEVAEIYGFIDDGSGDFHPDDIKGSDSVFLVGRADDRPVACGAIRPLEPGVAEVKRMFVVPDYRGRGYSKAMLSALEGFARSAGYSAVRL